MSSSLKMKLYAIEYKRVQFTIRLKPLPTFQEHRGCPYSVGDA